MSYRLSLADDVATSVRTAAREQLEGAIGQLERAGSPGEDAVDAIHSARKHLKKARALLRLVRPALGRDTYRRENAALREIAGELSAARDADVLVATVEGLADRYAGRLSAADFEAVRSALAAAATAARGARGGGAADDAPAAAAASGDGDTAGAPDLDALTVRLRDAVARVDEWPLAEATWDDVLAGAVRQYARGRDARDAAREQASTELLHAWRKRVKDLWYHHRLLSDAFKPVMKAYADAAHELSEQLGDDHDLAVLRERIERGLPLPAGTAADAGALLALVDERRAELERAAQELGLRLYGEPRKAFASRLTGWVGAAVDEATRSQPA